MTAGDEPREGVLLKRRNRAGAEAQPFPPEVVQSRRQAHVAYPHRGRDSHAERVHIDDPAGIVQPEHGRNGLSAPAEFTVVVVLNNVTVAPGSPFHQLQPP